MPRTPPDTERPLLVVPVQHDPQWRAVWSNGHRTQPAKPLRAFPQGAGGGWLASRVPGPGQWTLSWTYSPDSERLGQWISAPAWLVWTSFMVLFYLRPNLRRGRVSRQATWEGEAPAEPHE
jgi:hypothetical protein